MGDLAADELTDREDGLLRNFGLSEKEANTLIMAARAHWFDDDPIKDSAEAVEASDEDAVAQEPIVEA